jgi:EXS family
VAKDWDLTLFSKDRDDPEHPFGLRKHRYFRFKELYYFVIVLDLLLRFTWSIKLSPHLDRFNDLEGGIFAIEVLEVFRRWVWIFFRVETEWGKSPAFLPALLTLQFVGIEARRQRISFWQTFKANRTPA